MDTQPSRRLAAIVAADIAGYSRLMEVDEESTVREMNACRRDVIDPLLAVHNGRVANTAGDSLLLEFPSAVDAVRCAISVQQQVDVRSRDVPEDRQLKFRIGINVGDVIGHGDDLLGDGVNVAARLEGLSEPGGICISRSVRDQIVGKLDAGLEELGEIQVKNISRPVETYRVVRGQPARKVSPGSRAVGKIKIRWLFVIAGVVVAMLVGLYLFQTSSPKFEPAAAEAMALPLPGKPSIVVLPFANLSNDDEQTVFADGVTEDLITDLSKLSSLFVIGRNSSFSFKGQQVTIKFVAEKLGVRYVLTGSVRRAGDTLRINAQLLDALNGENLWAERFDGAVSDVFATQDAFTLRVVEALEVELSPAESAQIEARETEQVAAREAFQLGWELYSQFNEQGNRDSIPHFERAVELDPEYGRAYGALALAHLRGVIFHHWEQHTGVREQSALHLEEFPKALKAAKEHESSLIHVIRTIMQLNLRDSRLAGKGAVNDALIDAGQAIATQPNDPEAHIAMAWALLSDGRPKEALSFVRTSMRLDPDSPSHYAMFLAAAHFSLGDLDAAKAALDDGLERNPNAIELMPVAASIYSQIGLHDEARAFVKKWLPDAEWEQLEATVEKYFFVVRWYKDYQRLNMTLHDGLRRASLPDEMSVDALIDDIEANGIHASFKTAPISGLVWRRSGSSGSGADKRAIQ